MAVPDRAAARAVGANQGAQSASPGGGHPLRLQAGPGVPSPPECDKVRINPGNIGGEDRVKAVADACRQQGHSHPYRSQRRLSGEGDLLAKYGGVTPEALVESAFGHIRSAGQI
ncbi:MAG: flavodoxin-dependent (E)-4-hydroxy-3-methylbut-2-enyl-diphosphate synthase [Flavonifractor plautii]